jgi:flagellar hook-length control protein FliK
VLLLREQSGAVQTPQRQTIIVTENSRPVRQLPAEQIAFFDTLMYRRMLKIDKGELLVQENQSAALHNDKLGVPRAFGIPVARGFEELVKMKTVEAAQQPAAESASFVRAQMTMMSVEMKTAHVTMRSLEESVIMQVAQRLGDAVRSGVNEIRLTLRPESLGEVRIKIEMEGDIVSAKIHVENQQVKHIIENNFQSLKNALSGHNLQTGSFQVNVGNDGSQEAWNAAVEGQKQGSEGPAVNAAGQGGDAAGEAPMTAGNETGRRYGTNTVEYYA